MGLRFRKSKKILPGVKLNVGKKSVGVSLGGKAGGFSLNTKRGVTARGSIPGTGVSYTSNLTGGKSVKRSSGGGKKPVYKRPWFWVIIVVLVLGLGGLGSQDDKAKDEAAEVVRSVPEAAEEAEAAAEPAAQEPENVAEPEPEPVQTNPAYTDPNTREATFLLNTESMVFHDTGCYLVKGSDNPAIKSYTGTRQSVVDMGYSPCGRCHP